MSQRKKTIRKHRRHKQPCYCIRCESGKFDDYLEAKNCITKEVKNELYEHG